MEKSLLLAVSDDISSSWGMRFVANFFQHRDTVHLTLLYIAPAGYSASQAEESLILSDHQLRNGQEMVGTVKQWLQEHGFLESSISVKVLRNQFGVVRDIVTEAHKGLYDAVIVGRRYLDWMEMLYTTSVSRGILWESVNFPVWVCNIPDQDRRNILLCADGSAASARIADHVGFVMAHEVYQRVTVLHLRTVGVDAQQAIDDARQRVLDNGVADSRISTLVTDGQDKIETILRLAHDGKYAVVAVGRRPDLPESIVRRFFTRSVSLGLHENVNKFSLWVSR